MKSFVFCAVNIYFHEKSLEMSLYCFNFFDASRLFFFENALLNALSGCRRKAISCYTHFFISNSTLGVNVIVTQQVCVFKVESCLGVAQHFPKAYMQLYVKLTIFLFLPVSVLNIIVHNKPFKRQSHKMAKHTLAIRRQIADKLFECVWTIL